MTFSQINAASFADRCNADGEFQIAARYWSGGFSFISAHDRLSMIVESGVLSAGDPGDGPGVISLSGSWDALLTAVPPRFMNDIHVLIDIGLFSFSGDPLLFAQYYPALMRAVELLRQKAPRTERAPCEPARNYNQLDSPVGRYIHLDIEDQDYRIYYEEAGHGIPLLLQHTAGCHGSQWRHLFETPEITDHFHLIAYDLPFHGKSIPPVGPKWWAEEYKLTTSLVRAIPVALAKSLGLDRPVFMGCSASGVWALDLARYHPEDFRAVIYLEGALKIDYDIEKLYALWHPQVSNEFKARAMNAPMSPCSPESYRKETSQIYAAGWPPLFLGDLNYYLVEYDLHDEAKFIDTNKIAVHILSGGYDASGTIMAGKAHQAIAGSTFSTMQDVGHFPMSENPQKFIEYLLPILKKFTVKHNE